MSDSPWMSVAESARYARCSTRLLYSAIKNGKLRGARIGGGKKIILRREWIDAFLEAASTPQDIPK